MEVVNDWDERLSFDSFTRNAASACRTNTGTFNMFCSATKLEIDDRRRPWDCGDII
jgi:hypothetical protein